MSDLLRVAEVADRELAWTQASFARQEFALTAQGAAVGRLVLRGMLGTLAEGATGDGAWTFKRVGFWQQRATVRAAGSEADLAVFQNNTWKGGGTLDFIEGSRFRATTNFWNTRFLWQTEEEQTLVEFHHGGAFKLSSTVEIREAARALPQLPLLVLFGWYLCVMLHRDAGAHVVVFS
jgi:hypothetical protein